MNDIDDLIRDNGITMNFVFVPFIESRNCKDKSADWWTEPNWPSLNWRVTVSVNGRSVLTTDYAQGIGHIPGYGGTAQRMTTFAAGIVAQALNSGVVQLHHKPYVAKIGKIPTPSVKEVLASLLLDGQPDFDAESFADWCADYGYSEDSREAERVYNQCVGIGRKLRGALGSDTIKVLREAFQDY